MSSVSAVGGKQGVMLALHSGHVQLDGLPNILRVRDGTVCYVQSEPLAIEVVDDGGKTHWLYGGYASASTTHQTITAQGTLTSSRGTVFSITDTFGVLPNQGAFTLTREVTVVMAGADSGFGSRFSLKPERRTAMSDCDFFAPGLWYKGNTQVPPSALAAGPDDVSYSFREDRLPLPMMMLRDRRSGATLTLAHLDGTPTTFAGEDGLDRITDARMQFGSLGITNFGSPAPMFQFPGTEGERTYVQGAAPERDRWALRSHPVRTGFIQKYRLLLQCGHTPDFPAAVSRAWRTVYALQATPVILADLPKVYRDGMALLDLYSQHYHGVISVPFSALVPGGVVKDTSSQMGFVGQALPAAFLLLKHGIESRETEVVGRACEVVDFWARNSRTPSGLPRTWYDIHPNGTFTWRNDPTFLRVSSDGMDGALQAWNVMRRHGQDRSEWLAFCRHYGDWLVRAQNKDGSWAREYDLRGDPINPAKDTTDQPIPFLVDLYAATGDADYRKAARRAGEFCWRSVHLSYAYVGGTPDNPNVLDKEGGIMALAAFLALHDMTGDRKWLEAATQAAWYSETWVYCWNIPVPPDDPGAVFPKGRTTVGLSLIATGHSGADTYMSAAPFLYYRLSLLTGETHFRDVARMLLYDTKQLLDWDGTLGYRYPGLQTEALTLAPLRGHGQVIWLPWLTVAQLEPMVRLRDVFGSFDIAEIEQMPRVERLRRDHAFAKSHGFLSAD